MPVKAVTHLNFRGDARAAHLLSVRLRRGRGRGHVQGRGNVQDPSDADHVMWGQVAAASGFAVMAYDVPARQPWHPGENAFFVSLRGDAADEVTAYWERLSDGAAVLRPLGPAPWAPLYGMLKDRYGVVWVVDVATEPTAH
ncbi:VOC family protein [Nonomuraea antimicrobica]